VGADRPRCAVDVFLVAENRLLRDALSKVLSRRSDIRVVAATTPVPDLAEKITGLKPHILLVDSAVLIDSNALPVRDGTCPLKTVMIGMEADRETFVQCVRAGISGYLLKDASAMEVVAAIRTVASGGAVCPPSMCRVLFDYFASRCSFAPTYYAKVQVGLTRREQELALMIGEGLSNKEIASKLNLSEQTVKNHIHHMLRKLGADNRLAAVELCRMHGFIAPGTA